ncbi:unnamed protein product [Paramecium sonneborni]|uniref:Uncharacterized protein n=1 Tax=Paramecium sonneborni TaxID=65129 RepID=A0A8S1R248_9CILI|nr:unnamed protein product [Paramecium sonneborni]
MEDHQLLSFINKRMQFSQLKYQINVESMLFDSNNQEIIKTINQIFQQHIQLFQIIQQQNLVVDHISALVCKNILVNGFIERRLTTKLFRTRVFNTKQNCLALATIQFKNYMMNTLRILDLKDTALEELLKDQNIELQFDLEETQQFMNRQTQEEQNDFIRNYILFNLKNNKGFIQNLKLWRLKYRVQNNDQLKSNTNIQVHFLDWSEQVKDIIDKLQMTYYFKLGKFYLADVNDKFAFKPLNCISQIYEKKKNNFVIIDSLQNLIRNHVYDYNKIQVIFGNKSPKEVLISFLEILDWCQDILKWEKIIQNFVENIKKEYQRTISYNDSSGDGGFEMEEYLETILTDIITKYEERIDKQINYKFIDIDQLDNQKIEGILYEITKDGIDFYNDEFMICGSVQFSVQQKSRLIGKIGQLVMDMPEIQKINFIMNELSQEYLQTLWQCKNFKEKLIKQRQYKNQIIFIQNKILDRNRKLKVREIRQGNINRDMNNLVE